jgi:hypothetical protein
MHGYNEFDMEMIRSTIRPTPSTRLAFVVAFAIVFASSSLLAFETCMCSAGFEATCACGSGEAGFSTTTHCCQAASTEAGSSCCSSKLGVDKNSCPACHQNHHQLAILEQAVVVSHAITGYLIEPIVVMTDDQSSVYYSSTDLPIAKHNTRLAMLCVWRN